MTVERAAALSASEIDVRFGDAHVLRHASVVVPQGITALLGENGAGKTTLMRVLAGLVRPTAGRLVGPVAERRRAGRRAAGSAVGYMPQAVPVLRHMTVSQYLRYIAYLNGRRRTEAVREVTSVLARVDLTGSAHARTTSLSGGMRRRLGLAAALIGDPSVLLLDEPTVALDPTQRHRIRGIVRAIGQERPVLVSTHLAEDVAAIADRVVVLDGGRTVFAGSLATFASVGGQRVAATDVEQAFLAVVRGDAG